MSKLLDQIENTLLIPNNLAIFGLGQMGLAIKGPDAILYIDPCLSDIVRERFGEFWVRGYPPPIQPENVTHADFYLISHEHMDHLDPVTSSGIAKASPHAKFITTRWCEQILLDISITSDRHIFPKALEPITLPRTRIKITTIPSAHYVKEFDEQKGYRWLGFLIEWNGVVFYHAGDTIIYEDYIETLKKLPQIDVAMIPVNGRDYFRDNLGIVGNLLPEEAALLAQELGWDMVIAGHNDLYPNNAIPMGEIVQAFANKAPRLKYKFLQPGELYYYVK